MPTCYIIIVTVIYYLYCAIAVCEALQKIQVHDLEECRRGVKQKPEMRGGLSLWEG